MTLQIAAPVTSLGQLLTRRHDQLQELVPDDDHTQYMIGLGSDIAAGWVGNTVAETVVASVALGAVADAGIAQGAVLVALWRGLIVNNTGVDQTVQIRMKVGANTIGDTGARLITTSPTDRPALYQMYWQRGTSYGDALGVIGAAVAAPELGAPLSRGYTVFNLGAIGGGVNLTVTIQFGAADANLIAISRGLWVGRLRGP